MKHRRITRLTFVRGAASAVALGATLGTASKTSGATADGGDYIVGKFVSAPSARAGVVSTPGGEVSVALDPEAFVAHGADGVVDSLRAFIPGEEVVVRGERSELGVAAVEFQSVYYGVTGRLSADGAEYALVEPTGERVHVPQEVVERNLPSGFTTGEPHSATIWTHPQTGEAVALDISGRD